ncbi:MAG TPA: hypothetical protein VFG68_10610 [Fimbriiglobus sp.]|nr:hypothetical protein [Fimbriiglobus sp.]
MTVKELEKRVASLEAEVRELKAKLADKKPETKSWLDLAGKYANDPHFEEAMRLGREWREQVNRESLEEFDREMQAEARTKKTRKKTRARSGSK